jgi:hypothetical protein
MVQYLGSHIRETKNPDKNITNNLPGPRVMSCRKNMSGTRKMKAKLKEFDIY